MRNTLVLLIIILTACTDYHRYAITEEDAGLEYYASTFEDLKRIISEKPDDIDLRKQKLFVADKLGWPEDLQEDIELIIGQNKLDHQSYGLATAFYLENNQYQNLLGIIDYWESVYGVDSENSVWKTQAYLGLGNIGEAKVYLDEILSQSSNSTEELVFVANSYLSLSDTSKAVMAFERMTNVDIKEPLLTEIYIPVLLRIDSVNLALNTFERIAASKTLSLDEKLLYGEVSFVSGNRHFPHQLLEDQIEDTALLRRSDWYARSNEFDSAILFIDPVIASDSSTELLWKKAQLSSQRGLLYQSLRLYQIIQKKDTTNAIVQEEAKIVERKIAYLRKLRAQEKKIPMLDLNTKKSTNNE
ncbi:MAG: hypothetical protein JXR10_08945 [Cyclobacteriaceae bacterium]